MSSPHALTMPPIWCNQDLMLYHGTLDQHEASILNAIDPDKGKPNADFGTGFYTTTVRRQAESWAWQLSVRNPGSSPAVFSLHLKRDELAKLESLWFVRGSFDATDFWSVVFHCRQGGDHQRPEGWYDVVIGPVAAFWRQRLVIYDADQVSFHTTAAADLLNNRSKTTIRRVL